MTGIDSVQPMRDYMPNKHKHTGYVHKDINKICFYEKPSMRNWKLSPDNIYELICIFRNTLM